MDLGGNGGRGGNGGAGVRAGTTAGADADANGERGSGRGGEGGESHTECSGKKSGSKDGDRNGGGIGESLRALGVLDGPSGLSTAMEWKRTRSFLFDKQRGILYTYKQDAYQCGDGTSQNGDVLMGIYTQGNSVGRPSGSGWYVVAVKAGQCGEKKAGLFGCRFDAGGKPTTCGTAKVKEESGEVEVVVKK